LAAQRRVQLQRGEVPGAGKSPAGRRRSNNLFALSCAADRHHRTQSNCLPGRGRRKNSAANQSRHFPVSRRVAGISRKKIAGDLSPRLFAAQSARKKLSLERSPKSDGSSWPRSEERQVLLTHHGNSAGLADGADLGRRGFNGAFCHASHWRSAFHVVYATGGFSFSRLPTSDSWGMGASCGWFWMASLGLGLIALDLQCPVRTRAL